MRLRAFPRGLIAASVLLATLAAAGAAQRGLPAGVQFEQAYNHMQSADLARDSGDHTEAMDLYRRALNAYIGVARRYPDWQAGVTRYRIAYCQQQLHLLMDAALRQATVVAPSDNAAPSDPDAQASDLPVRAEGETPAEQAAVLISHERHAQARAILLEALRASPDDLRLRTLMGVVGCRQGKFLDAVYVLEPVISEQPGLSDARVALATAYVGLGRPQQAVEQLDAAIVANARHPEAHYNLAQLLLRGSEPDVDGAEQHYQACLESGGVADAGFEARLAEAQRKAGLMSRLKFW